MSCYLTVLISRSLFWRTVFILLQCYCTCFFTKQLHAIHTVTGAPRANVGPGPPQIWRVSGFVNSKTDGENAAFLSELWCDLQASHGNFSVSFRWAPLELMGPLLGPLKPTAFLKPMGPQKSMGPGDIVPPCPPLSMALHRDYEMDPFTNDICSFLNQHR